MKKILVVFGTRPEAIKLAPVIEELKLHPEHFNTVVCVTGQHRHMLDQVLTCFGIMPDHDMNVMSTNQDLFTVTGKILLGLKEILDQEKPDLMIVQGDTTTAFVASLAGFYHKVEIAHVEAGLRTKTKYNPFPEEKNRCLVAALADYHFAPTVQAQDNLLQEGISADSIWVTGNTGIDALFSEVSRLSKNTHKVDCSRFFPVELNNKLNNEAQDRKLILVTGHRRENFGEGLQGMCIALREIALRNQNVDIVFAVHLNPNVRKTVFEILNVQNNQNTNIYLLDPLEYSPFVFLMHKAYFIMTDSGGIQEEAPSLGKMVLVMRDTTERPEGVEAQIVQLVGTQSENIIQAAQFLLNHPEECKRKSRPTFCYGDGLAAQRIVKVLKQKIIENQAGCSDALELVGAR